MRIRDDLVGVVLVQTDAGVLMLAAGEAVPEGVSVGDHVRADRLTAVGPGAGVDERTGPVELGRTRPADTVPPRRRGRPPKNRGV